MLLIIRANLSVMLPPVISVLYLTGLLPWLQIQGGLAKMEETVLVKIVQKKQGLKEIPCEISSSVFYDIDGEKVDGND